MSHSYEEAISLLRQMTRPAFATLDAVGLLVIFVGVTWGGPAWKEALTVIGSTLTTLGLSLPIAIYYQSKHNNQSFQLVNACNSAGIQAIFPSRGDSEKEFRAALSEAAHTTSEIRLLGVAFRNTFAPNDSGQGGLAKRLRDPLIPLRVLILDPVSESAIRRAKIEIGGSTIADISFTLETGLPSTLAARLKGLTEANPTAPYPWRSKSSPPTNLSALDAEGLARALRVEVRVYSNADPILFSMMFESTMFIEQYHFGRPRGLVEAAGCIGKHVPVIQYRGGSKASRYYDAHFEYLWKNGKSVTTEIAERAITLVNLVDEESRA